MKGVFNTRPPTPRYVDTWDPELVLDLLRGWSPASTIDFRTLTFKVVVLILLVSGQRIQTLSLLDVRHMLLGQKCITFRIFALLKQTRPGYKNPEVTLRAYPDKHLCVFTYLNEYLQRTRHLRKGHSKLFLTIQKPFTVASKDTITRWVQTVMKLAGINTDLYAPHSIRCTSSSAAKRDLYL